MKYKKFEECLADIGNGDVQRGIEKINQYQKTIERC